MARRVEAHHPVRPVECTVRGKLRHARLLGVRFNKPAHDVRPGTAMNLRNMADWRRYCARSVAAGSRRTARRIGTNIASAAQAIRTDTATPKAIGSNAGGRPP